MKQFFLTWGAVVVLTATCVSCDKVKPPQPELQPPPVSSSPNSAQENERKAFSQAAEKELDELRLAIAEFRTKTGASNRQTKATLNEEVDKLEAELRETQQRLLELKSATVESWSQVKESFGVSREKLKNGIDNFRKYAV